MERKREVETVEDVEAWVEEIRHVRQDDEVAHIEEDDMRAAVLRAVARGIQTDTAQIMAARALSTDEIDFARWHA